MKNCVWLMQIGIIYQTKNLLKLGSPSGFSSVISVIVRPSSGSLSNPVVLIRIFGYSGDGSGGGVGSAPGMLPYSETLLSAPLEFELRMLESVVDWLLEGDKDLSPPPNESELGVIGGSTIGSGKN